MMRTFLVSAFSVLALSFLGCSNAARMPAPEAWESAEEMCTTADDAHCGSLLCHGDACGLYRCEDVPGAVELARFPPARPPAAAAAPGRGPRRNWGGGQNLPRGAVMVFPNWNGAAGWVVPPSRGLTAGRWEKHHIFPQARDLAEWFRDRGLRIHDYTLPIPRDIHQRIHKGGESGGAWNRAWREFRLRNENASPEEIFKHAGELIYRFQLMGGPIRAYHSKPGT
ncbi:putative lipoprotein [Myxococcus xanthus DK 1622]|uniref:Lipoprotein n=2 Tax=Myxococcus xanthus TaxID=34 RepID=Q1D9F8_MYXXD|nr:MULTISPECIES: TIGR02269 family lipoprotein [Myxococcus]ABF88954.1 putative lipoprotein [Myxococcus xanthus DK 1622]NOJ54091.1 TIGR02269 family lipoprotein [Myxococcus xanthus]QPM82008.1 TIGR02269 family lipoprotein [Myxococcus xanthus]QVW71257.1 TIGR02269 family lipoprotein [Myxococcus xanthus DZ2]UEO02613.1 TIGR02269 family lipoprotein [Myxococcus xanthus DZ2]